jgi:hypothetical protein
MAPNKSATLNLRIRPNLKDALRTAAHRQNRSIANMVETMIQEHCRTHDIAIPDQQSLPFTGTSDLDHGKSGQSPMGDKSPPKLDGEKNSRGASGTKRSG